jgi:DtxR family Mn-dependent transcriptional regulator
MDHQRPVPTEDESIERFGGETRVTQAMEDYLKAAYRLEQEGGAVTTLRLAEELGFSGPSVTNMVKRLDELKLVVHNRYHGVELTPTGRSVALEVIRHHRLLELYLSKALGYNLEEVHQEAERLEHHVSEELEARIERVLNFPRFDPHGDPIPSRSGALPAIEDQVLSDVALGSTGRISRVSDRDPEKLRYLSDLGLKPGIELTVSERMPFEGPVRVRVDGVDYLVPFVIARLVRVNLTLDAVPGNDSLTPQPR